MYEFKSSVGSSALKANNENARFLTPRNSSNSSRKPLFSDKKKTALGDLKNTFIPLTPLKHGSVFTEEIKNRNVFQPPTNFKKTNGSEVFFSTPQISKSVPPKANCVHQAKNKIIDDWTERLMLTDEQFNLLFMEPTHGIIAPPEPEPELDECPDLHIECSSPFWERFDNQSTYDRDISSCDELPSLNMDFFNDLCISPLKSSGNLNKNFN